MSTALLDIHALRQTFPKADGGELLVLDGVELELNQGRSSACSAVPGPENQHYCA